MWAAGILAIDAASVGGAVVRARAGPIRDHWLEWLRSLLPPGTPFRRVPIHVSDDRLLGGLDLTATLDTGRAVAQRGLLAETHGGIALFPMAERIDEAVAARLASVLDTGEILLAREGLEDRAPARVGIVALDEGVEPDETPPETLRERLGLWMDFSGTSLRDVDVELPFDPLGIEGARARLADVKVGEPEVEALCQASIALGIESMRAPLQALSAARAAAALRGAEMAEPEDVALAARLVLGPRAQLLPQIEPAPQEETDEATTDEPPPPQPNEAPEPDPPAPEEPADAPPPQGEDTDAAPDLTPAEVEELAERVLDAVRASLPPGLMDRLAQGRVRATSARAAGKAGAQRMSLRRGRPAGVRAGDPASGARVHVLETLRAAAPWQSIRRSERERPSRPEGAGLEIRRSDLRVTRYRERSETTVIFAVDASGSTALARLAEAKGAVELLLADCYVRRDHVALIAFRGEQAELILPPTRSLVRAKRSLSGLPGGGGTPLSSALDMAYELATGVERRGGTPLVVLLTDGQANIARDGSPGRPAAARDAKDAAMRLRETGCASLLVDTSARSRPEAVALADELGARYQLLPRANAAALCDVVRSETQRTVAATGS